MGEKNHTETVTLESLRKAREEIAKGLNKAMTEVARSADGRIVYPTREERDAAVEAALRK